MSERLFSFATRVLEAGGALVEPTASLGLDVLLPAEAQRQLALPEQATLVFGAEIPEGSLRIGLESDWLERLGGLLGDRGWHGRLVRTEDPGSPPGSPERILEHQLSLSNAVYRFQGVETTRTCCLILSFRYSAVSDEKREGYFRLGRNLGNGAPLDGLLESLVTWQEEGREAEPSVSPPDLVDAHHLGVLLARHDLPREMDRRLRPFLDGMRRRQERDLERLHAYHSDLRREVQNRMSAAHRKAPEKREEEVSRGRMRLAAIQGEYQAKVADLWRKYAVTVQVACVQTLVLDTPVHRFHLLVKRRKGERRLHLDWHPAGRRLEWPPCEAGLPLGCERLVCDEALHLTSPAGMAECVACGKPFCHACHPEHCPKCRVSWIKA